MELQELHDALGKPVEFGTLYGFCSNSNGWTRVTVGHAIKATPSGKLTIRVKNVLRHGYSDEHKDEAKEKPSTGMVTVFPGCCFPVHDK